MLEDVKGTVIKLETIEDVEYVTIKLQKPYIEDDVGGYLAKCLEKELKEYKEWIKNLGFRTVSIKFYGRD